MLRLGKDAVKTGVGGKVNPSNAEDNGEVLLASRVTHRVCVWGGVVASSHAINGWNGIYKGGPLSIPFMPGTLPQCGLQTTAVHWPWRHSEDPASSCFLPPAFYI